MYNVEEYWSKVADRIDERSGRNVIAGDDEPYYRLKRKKFLQLFLKVDYKSKSVLEIGPGPGGNLNEVFKKNPAKLVGADISSSMIKLAKKHLPESIELVKINGATLPFKDHAFDMVYSVTVLQHNTDQENLESLMKEMARVSATEIFLYERVEKTTRGDSTNIGRPIDYYKEFFEAQGFRLASVDFLNIQLSALLAGFTRNYLNSSNRIEGEPLNKFSLFVQKIGIPITAFIDRVIAQKRDLSRMHFVRRNN